MFVFVFPGVHVQVETPYGHTLFANLPGGDIRVPGVGLPGNNLYAEQILRQLENAGPRVLQSPI